MDGELDQPQWAKTVHWITKYHCVILKTDDTRNQDLVTHLQRHGTSTAQRQSSHRSSLSLDLSSTDSSIAQSVLSNTTHHHCLDNGDGEE
jgi:hypothetical protein